MDEQEEGLSPLRRRINPDRQNCSPRCPADPAPLGSGWGACGNTPLCLFLLLCPLLDPLSASCASLTVLLRLLVGHRSESGEDPTANLGASLVPGSERSPRGSPTAASLGSQDPIPVLEILLLNRLRDVYRMMMAPSVQSICLSSCFYRNGLY